MVAHRCEGHTTTAAPILTAVAPSNCLQGAVTVTPRRSRVRVRSRQRSRLTIGELRPDSRGWQGDGMLDRWIDPGRQANIGAMTPFQWAADEVIAIFARYGRFTNRR